MHSDPQSTPEFEPQCPTTPTPTPAPHPTTTTNVDQGRGGGGNEFQEVSVELQRRGVNASIGSLLKSCSLEAMSRTIVWWDGEQTNERPPGVGVLVETIRHGGVVERPKAKSLLDRQQEYGDQIVAWLTENFPDLVDPREGPHPAAITAVIHLHYKHGKGRLTKREHGPEIRAAVKAFNAKWLEPEESAA